MNNENPIYQLVNLYNHETVTHGTWLASLIIAAFAFMGLALTSETPRWEWSGAFLILWLLSSLMAYVIGRLIYFSSLVSILVGHIVPNWFQTLQSVNKEVDRAYKELKNTSCIKKFGWQYRNSFSLSSLFISFALGFFIAIGFFLLGFFYLGESMSPFNLQIENSTLLIR